MKLSIINKNLQSYRISKDFEIELENGKTININKYYFEDVYTSEADWNFLDVEDRDVFNNLTEDEQDKFYSFINSDCKL